MIWSWLKMLEINKLDGRIDTIPIQKVLDYMGFPKNYLEIVEM